jgi:cob(I)alamin adenosyltransferase
LYTRGGDKGETSLYGPRRVPKDSPRVEAYGTIDELNSFIGVAVASCGDAGLASQLREVQRLLFVAGADLASDLSEKKTPRIGEKEVAWVEDAIDAMLPRLPKLTRFILPGGTPPAAGLQAARAVCRRAERRVVSALKSQDVNPQLIPFLNRLSTYLFDAARLSNTLAKAKEEEW